MAAAGVFVIFTLLNAPLFSTIAFTRGIRQVVNVDDNPNYYLMQQAFAQLAPEPSPRSPPVSATALPPKCIDISDIQYCLLSPSTPTPPEPCPTGMVLNPVTLRCEIALAPTNQTTSNATSGTPSRSAGEEVVEPVTLSTLTNQTEIGEAPSERITAPTYQTITATPTNQTTLTNETTAAAVPAGCITSPTGEIYCPYVPLTNETTAAAVPDECLSTDKGIFCAYEELQNRDVLQQATPTNQTVLSTNQTTLTNGTTAELLDSQPTTDLQTEGGGG